MPKRRADDTLYDVAVHAVAVLIAAERMGLDQGELLATAGIHPEILDPPYSTIAYQHLGRLIELVKARTGCASLGIEMALEFPSSSMGAVHYYLLAVQTAGEALRLSYETLAEFSNVLRVEIHEDADVARVSYTPSWPDVPGVDVLVEFHMAHFTKNFRGIIGPEYAPRAVHCRTTAPADPFPIREFMNCPVHFEAAENIVELDRNLLAHRIPTADPDLQRILEGQFEDLRAGLPGSDGLVHAIRKTVAQEVDAGRVTMRRIAAKISVPERTLQHRLQRAGTTFRQLVDEARAARATVLLANSHLSVMDVAFKLGFSSTGSFHRAFHRWTGRTPWEYRKIKAAPPDL